MKTVITLCVLVTSMSLIACSGCKSGDDSQSTNAAPTTGTTPVASAPTGKKGGMQAPGIKEDGK